MLKLFCFHLMTIFELTKVIGHSKSLWVGLEPTKQYIFRAEIEKYFCWFLVQIKTVEFAFEINWPLDSWTMRTKKVKNDWVKTFWIEILDILKVSIIQEKICTKNLYASIWTIFSSWSCRKHELYCRDNFNTAATLHNLDLDFQMQILSPYWSELDFWNL